MNVGKSTAAKALIYLNNKLAIQGKDTWLRINDGKPFTSGVYFGSSLVRTDGTLQVGDSGSALNVTTSAIQLKQPTTISSTLSVTSNSTLSTTSITTATVGQLNAQNANVYGTLRAASYSIESVQNLGGHFLVCPTIEVPSAASGFSAQVTRTSSTQIRIAFTDNSLSTDTFNGTTWTPNSKVKVSGMINNIALGTCDGVIESWNKSSKVVTVLITCDVATSFSTTATSYTASQVSDLSIMMYELYNTASDTTYRIGVYLTAYGENKYSYVDVYGGTSNTPTTRMGKLDGLPNVNNTAPTGWGFYSAQNGYFSGTVVSNAGHIGGFYLGQTAIYSTTNALGTTANNVYLGSEGISLGTTFKVTKAGELTATSGHIGNFFLSNALYSGTNSISSTTAGIYLGTDGIRNYKDVDTYVNIQNGVITAKGVSLTGKISATTGNISGSVTIGGTKTASTVLSDITDAAKKATNYIMAGDSGLMVADMRSGSATPSMVTGKNVLIDSDSVDIRDGQDVLASFGEETVIGSPDGWNQKLTSGVTEFKYGSETFAYISAGKFNIVNLEIIDAIYIGNYSIRVPSDGKLTIGRRR